VGGEVTGLSFLIVLPFKENSLSAFGKVVPDVGEYHNASVKLLK
jgi:hypothetical protein